MTFNATARRGCCCSASYTTPIPPSPSFRMILKSPMNPGLAGDAEELCVDSSIGGESSGKSTLLSCMASLPGGQLTHTVEFSPHQLRCESTIRDRKAQFSIHPVQLPKLEFFACGRWRVPLMGGHVQVTCSCPLAHVAPHRRS